MYNQKVYEKAYPIITVIFQNLFFLLYFGVGFMGMLPIKICGVSIISLFYLLFLIAMLLFILRKHLCTNCYYYGKRCATGWGKLSSLMFKEKSGNYELGIKLAKITWGLATIIPIIAMLLLLVISFSGYRLTLLGLFIFLTPINFLLHKNSCKRCKMKTFCPVAPKK